MSNQILLVEDDLDVLEAYAEYLRLTGHSIIKSTNGKQALELYKANLPCMVFSDIKMPEMDGYELFSRIREFDPNVKMILVIGHEEKEKSITAKNNGLLDVLYKPVDNDVMVSAIAENDC